MAIIVPSGKRVVPRVAINGRSNNNYRTANPGGAAGSSTMSFYAVCEILRDPGSTLEYIFARNTGVNSGWRIYLQNSLIVADVANSTPALVTASISNANFIRVPLIILVTYVNGVITMWINGIQQSTATLGAGFTSVSNATSIGCRSDGGSNNPLTDAYVAEVGMFQGTDLTATALAQSQTWMEDLQQGRYLTAPSAVVNSDFMWSARDAIAGNYGKVSFVDRISSSTMTRTNLPQAAQIMPRF